MSSHTTRKRSNKRTSLPPEFMKLCHEVKCTKCGGTGLTPDPDNAALYNVAVCTGCNGHGCLQMSGSGVPVKYIQVKFVDEEGEL